ncbi:helix-turn-helix domain-containing protein [Actinomadura sp. SCN-SB]|uniref:AraC-like ligand-binding domain-containing protein n=1 Tax=Actinomadura sp. SCN-SB TaxID=3373092 RepID=UPI0037534C48
MTILCDTGAVEPCDRFELWSQALASSFFPVRVERPPKAPFNGRLAGHSLGPLQIFHVTASASAPVRTEACVREGDPGHLQVHLLRRGRCRATQEDRSSEARAGDITLIVSSRPFTLRASGHDLLIFSLPLRLLGPYARRIGRSTAIRIPGDRGLAARVGPFLSGLADGLRDGSVAPDDVALADGVLALTRALCGPSGLDGLGDVRVTPSGGLLTAVKSYIENHLHEPGLRPETIAAAHFVSTRHLHKLFEAEELTLFRYIQHRRLQRCCDDLRDPGRADEPIASIAARWGFRNRDVFTRLFRTSYGMTPQELRAQALQRTPPPFQAREAARDDS